MIVVYSISARIAIVGTGYVADLYMPSLATFPGLTITGIHLHDRVIDVTAERGGGVKVREATFAEPEGSR